MNYIPYGRHDVSDADIQAVVDVLRSDFLTQGPAVPLFENTISEYCKSNYAVAVNSATSALHLACLALGVGNGDSVWTSPITFVASANCALYCGAKVDFVDIDPRTYNLCPLSLSEKLEKAEKLNSLPKVLIPVHFSGQSCEMERIHELSLRYDFKIIEDASHAIGGDYKNEKIGNCKYSDITIFSFHPVKIITTGEGGVASTNNKYLAEQMSLLRSHGITRNPEEMIGESDGPWYYQQIDLGYNYRMTDIQAALGRSQMARVDQYVTRRHELAKRYNELLGKLPVTLPWQHPDSYSAVHLYVICLQLDQIKKTHREVFEEMRMNGIGVNLHYIPVHTQPYYKKFDLKYGNCPNAEKYYAEAISLPIYPKMSEVEQDKVISTLKKALQV